MQLSMRGAPLFNIFLFFSKKAIIKETIFPAEKTEPMGNSRYNPAGQIAKARAVIQFRIQSQSFQESLCWRMLGSTRKTCEDLSSCFNIIFCCKIHIIYMQTVLSCLGGFSSHCWLSPWLNPKEATLRMRWRLMRMKRRRLWAVGVSGEESGWRNVGLLLRHPKI